MTPENRFFVFLAVSLLAVEAGALACSGQSIPTVDPARSLADLKAACAALNAPVTAPVPPPPPATGGTGGVVTVATEATGGAP